MSTLFRILQWIWGFPQTFLGFLLYRMHPKQPQRVYHGCKVLFWEKPTSISLGMYLLVNQYHYTEDSQLLVHEFGHSILSLLLGPMYLLIIGIPSLLWGVLPRAIRFREEKEVSYYAFFTEKIASWLGRIVTGEPCDMV